VLTVPQAARRAGKDPETVRRWIRSGKLRSRKIGTQHMIEEAELHAFLDDGNAVRIPAEWRTTDSGRPQPDWVRLVRESRESH
jgi:excisionase family DNA binding protein